VGDLKKEKRKQLRIGSVALENPFFLAPLAGITDGVFRRLCKKQGAGLVYSEMVSGKGLFYNDKATERLLRIYEEEKPVAFQVFGADPKIMEITAKTLAERDNCLLDINMGCPVPKVVKNGEGSALLRDVKLAAQLVKSAVSHAGKPVTVKTRIGWDEETKNVVSFAKAMEEAGASAIAVHGRTREQLYTGKADWSYIKEVKNAVEIPVIGNGDIFCGEDAIRMLEETGCDFVMIARGALGNPWIFKEALALWNGETLPMPPSFDEKLDTIKKQLTDLCEEKGEYAAVREMRKHVGWYLKGIYGSAEIRRKVNEIQKAEKLLELFESLQKRNI